MTHSEFLDSLNAAEARKYLDALDAWLVDKNPDATADDYYWHSLLLRKVATNPTREEYDLLRAAELDPKHVDVWVGLGHLAISQRQLDKAVAYYERGIQALPTNFFPWYGRALAFMEMGRFADAMRDIDRAISIHPNLACGYELRAQIFEKMEDCDRALEDANVAVDSHASRDWTHKLQRRISRKLAERDARKGEMEKHASLVIVGWAIRVAAWDSLLPIFVLAAPFVADRLTPNNRNLSEIVGAGVPIIACIIRAIVGFWHVQSNRCSAVMRTFQYCILCVALLSLVLLDTLMVLTHDIQQGPRTLADYLVFAVVLSVYLPCIAFAMYPGRK